MCRVGVRNDDLGRGMRELRQSNGARLEHDVCELSSTVLRVSRIVSKSVHDHVDPDNVVISTGHGVLDCIRKRGMCLGYGRGSRVLQQHFKRCRFHYNVRRDR